jgi:hypothetical protein
MRIVYVCKHCNEKFDSIASATLHSFQKHPKESQVRIIKRMEKT